MNMLVSPSTFIYYPHIWKAAGHDHSDDVAGVSLIFQLSFFCRHSYEFDLWKSSMSSDICLSEPREGGELVRILSRE